MTAGAAPAPGGQADSGFRLCCRGKRLLLLPPRDRQTQSGLLLPLPGFLNARPRLLGCCSSRRTFIRQAVASCFGEGEPLHACVCLWGGGEARAGERRAVLQGQKSSVPSGSRRVALISKSRGGPQGCACLSWGWGGGGWFLPSCCALQRGLACI